MRQTDFHFYEFGPFRMDVTKRVLLRDGEVVPLAAKTFDMLLILVEHQGEVLDKDHLMALLWPDSFVEEANLPQNISALRKALGETPHQRRYIVTIPGRGYRFAADVEKFSAENQHLLVEKYTRTTLVIQDQGPGHELDPLPNALPLVSVSSRLRRRSVLLGLALLILALVGVITFLLLDKSQPVNKEIHSLVILPFVNASDEPGTEYLSDGIAESLINSLSQLSKLKVIARTTAFRYKGKETEAQAIGRDLRVDAIITGRVTLHGETLIVQADLLNAADGSQVWGARYSRKLSDVFAVQEQIAKEIAGNLQFKLTGEENLALSKRYTENIRAYQNYLLGWSYLQRRTGEDYFKAVSYFEKAIAEEPNYALAYAALTEVYVSLTIRGLIEPAEGRRNAEEKAKIALSLDPNLAEAHVAIGATHIFFAPFNFAAGDRELRRAIELSPNLAIAHLDLGASLQEQGRLDEALEIWLRGREIDPLSPIIARLEATVYLHKRNYARAFELLRQSKDLGPSFIIWSEVEIYLQNGKLNEAVAELEKAKLERKDDPFLIYSAGMIAAAQGKHAEAFRIIEELKQLSGASLHRAMWIAMIYAALNKKELALEWLERGLQAEAISIFYKEAPVWDSVRSDPRFNTLLKRMGIIL
jgi:TolB-like protein/DNA-binding winged helix-turn-helix (wHTH) protein/Tfp pilus assembly protein PilF